MIGREFEFIKQLVKSIGIHRGFSDENTQFFNSGSDYVIDLKETYSESDIISAMNFQVAVMNCIAQYEIPFTQQVWANDNGEITDILISLKISDAVKLNRLLSTLWQ